MEDMHINHIFKQPEDINVKIWRYMDLSKLLSMIDSNSLFFTRADKFEDPYEGFISNKTKEFRRSYLDKKVDEDIHLLLDKVLDKQIKFTAINCWHENNYESAAMWKLYLKSGDGIAIQSTYKSFCKCFKNQEKDILIGKVEYVDYKTEIIQESGFVPFMYKRKSFEHEKEIRALIHEFPLVDNKLDYNIIPPFESGLYISVDLNELIHRVYIAPNAPIYLKEVVQSLLKKYKLEKEVIQSNLYSSPIQ